MTNKEMIEPWRQYGVRLEKEDTVDGVTHLYISVPKMSDFFDDNGNELSGALLAKRVKRSISDPIVLRSRTRNERWTKNMSYNIDYKPDKKNEQRSNHIPKQATMICLIFLISSLDMGTKIHSLNERSV